MCSRDRSPIRSQQGSCWYRGRQGNYLFLRLEATLVSGFCFSLWSRDLRLGWSYRGRTTTGKSRSQGDHLRVIFRPRTFLELSMPSSTSLIRKSLLENKSRVLSFPNVLKIREYPTLNLCWFLPDSFGPSFPQTERRSSSGTEIVRSGRSYIRDLW